MTLSFKVRLSQSLFALFYINAPRFPVHPNIKNGVVCVCVSGVGGRGRGEGVVTTSLMVNVAAAVALFLC